MVTVMTSTLPSVLCSTVDAKFSSDGRKINYKGSGEITLRLKWDDNPRKYGVAVDSIAVGGKFGIAVTAESSTIELFNSKQDA